MTSLQIQYFLKVAECMSFSRAAAELYVSQPSVSRQIRLLETELGHELFDRTQKNRISLTAAGMIFRESFAAAESGLQGALAAAERVRPDRPLRLRVGVGTGWDFSAELAAFRGEVLRRYPRAELRFESHDFRTLRELLRARRLDLTLCTKTSIMDFEGIEMAEVANLESRAYALRGLLCPADGPLRVEHLEGHTLLMLNQEESPMAMELVQLQLQARQIRVTPAWLPNRDTILQSLLLGEGFAVFDQYMYFRTDPRLTFCRLDDMIPICAVWNRDDRNPLINLFTESFTLGRNAAEQPCELT